MTPEFQPQRPYLFGLGFLTLWLFGSSLLETFRIPEARYSWAPSAEGSEAIVGPSQCAECHMAEFEVWKTSGHESGSKMLTRSKQAKEIAKALGIRRIKNDSRCTSCHFTMNSGSSKPKALAGVSCESCHGAAENWLEAHQNFGAKGALIAEETVAHRQQRYSDCDSAGMVRVGRVHAMAAQCLSCHVINDEELVDLAGHPDGMAFELLAWSQGEVRHNFVRGAGENASASLGRKRMLFIAGQMQTMNFSLRALASAEGGGSFEEQNTQRVLSAIETLQAMAKLVYLPELETVLEGSDQWDIAAGCSETAELIAQRVAHCSVVLENRTDGSEFEAIDGMLPDAELYKGTARK